MGPRDELTRRVRTAHADAWEVQGRLRESYGGGAVAVRGARLMASGIPVPKWNNADVISADVDVDAIASWYRARDVPWGVRVPVELTLELGTPLFTKRCMGMLRRMLAVGGGGISVRRAGPAEAARFAQVEADLTGGPLAESSAWIAPEFASTACSHWIAESGGQAVGIATTVRSDGEAGPAAYLTGLVGAADEIRTALTLAAAAHAFAHGVELVHTNPDDDAEARRLAALGFIDVPGFLVRVARET